MIGSHAPAEPFASRVLVVDDNDANLALMAAILRGGGFTDIELIADSALVLDAVERFEPDVILLDLQMPGLDGFQVMELLTAASSADDFLPVMVVTADATTATRERVLSSGAKDLLIKPIDRVEVLQRTANLLETRHLNQQLRAHNLELERDLNERAAEEQLEEARRSDLRRAIRFVLGGQRLRSVFQPIVDVHARDIIGVEALTRFDTEPVRSPASWFAEASEVGLGPELEIAAVRCALRCIDELPAAAYLSLNCSPTILRSPELAALLDDVDPLRIVLEITEHHEILDYASTQDTLSTLRRRGIRFAVDDAGSGYSSLNHILELRPDIIKLDIALTSGIDRHPAKRALAAAMVTFATEVGASLVAEGVETIEELDTLTSLGIRSVQGYLLGRPQTPPLVVNDVIRERPARARHLVASTGGAAAG
ncbi:MAG: EAL domain-containing response regulator [Ilumatobacter sp.]|uniref:EAL domain-containing response regulator n=1 Tax=Ilumatobacter sp. TaxID=1967498 RepID=UPI003C78DDAF